MRGLPRALVVALVGSLALAMASTVTGQEVDVSGEWNLTMLSGDPAEPARGTLLLEQQGVALSGEWSRQGQVDASIEVTGEVEGSTVRFSWDVAGGARTSFVGEVREGDADVMAGTFQVGEQASGEWTARRGGAA